MKRTFRGFRRYQAMADGLPPSWPTAPGLPTIIAAGPSNTPSNGPTNGPTKGPRQGGSSPPSLLQRWKQQGVLQLHDVLNAVGVDDIERRPLVVRAIKVDLTRLRNCDVDAL
jgi:hypothetical protein